MRVIFADILKKLRAEKGLSQRELAERLYVTRSTVARWENGSRLPDASMISRLSRCLNADFSTLLSMAAENDNAPNVIMVDGRKDIPFRSAACSGRGYAECNDHRLYQSV